MDRSREVRKVSMAAPASLARRRHRGSGLRDSPDEDGTMELQGTARLRDRKKERERERERERLNRNKRRRGDRLIHAGNREDGLEESTDESANDDDEEDYDDDGGGGAGGMTSRMPPPNPASTSSPSLSNHYQNHHRRNLPQSISSTKMFRPASPWKPADEMIGVAVPRKARSASTKRAHDCWASASGAIIGGDQLHRQASTSPARSSLASATASPSRISPPPSNISIRKKLKPSATNKHRTAPKASTSKAASSNQDEIEFEIAEVLYGLMKQPPGAVKPEGGVNETLSKSTSDSKSRVSSPVSTAAPHQNAGSSAIVATVPKRKKPRPVNYGDEIVGFPAQANFIPMIDVEQVAKGETLSIEKIFKPVLANDRLSPDLEQSRDDSLSEPKADLTKLVRNTKPESENLEAAAIVTGVEDEDAILDKRDSLVNRFDENCEDNCRPTASGLGIKQEKIFQIDLMAPPQAASRLSPERDGNIQYISPEPKNSVPGLDEQKPVVKDVENTKQAANDSRNLVEPDLKRFKRGVVEESEVHRASFGKERSFKLQLNSTAKNDGESGMAIAAGANRQEVPNQAQPNLPRVILGDEATGDKTVHAASSLPSTMCIPGWQGGLPPLGYMTPFQGVVSMDGSTLSSTPVQPPQLLLNQSRPKRCATHCYIAGSISYHQQFTRMNPFWPAAAGNAATLYGANTCNLNVMPRAELHGSTGVRGVNPVPDKSLGVFPSSNTSKEKSSQGPNNADTAQRKQILVQQSAPAGAPSNLLLQRGPAFIFPLSQQQAAAASAVTAKIKNPPVAGASPTGNVNSGSGIALSEAPTTMSFNYPNMAANETQFLAILQNNPYQFPFPTHAGAPPVYRGAHPQAMPFFNGTSYSPQMLHPSQLQQQPQQSAHGHQIPPGHNMGISSGSSSSQKHLQSHPQKSQGNGSSAGTANMKQSFPSPKNRPSHLHLKQHNQHLTETGSEDSPSTADSRGSRSNFGMYTEGLSLPIHAHNLALMSASSISVGGGIAPTNGVTNGNHSEKMPQLPQQGLKVGVESLPSHQGFAVSFASLNGGGPPALDITSMGQNHVILQNFPDAARHRYQVMAAQAHQKQNFRFGDEMNKGSGDVSNVEEEGKSMASKGVSSNVGLSIAFSRSDLADSSVPGNNVVDSSSRNLKVRTSGPLMSTSMNNANSPSTQQQQQLQQQLHQQQQKAQLIQLQKQPQQYMAPTARGKTPSTSNGHVYSDHLPHNAAMAAKLTNSLSTFQQNHAPISGGSNSPTQSQHRKNSARTSISQVLSPASAPTNLASVKSHHQQQSQTSQQSHMQISFGGSNPKSLSAAHGQQLLTGHQSPSQIMVGSSNYKSGGSPRTASSGMVTNKALQASSLSPSASLQVKNSAMPSRSSSPVGARNVPSVLGNSNMGMPQGNNGSKPQMLQQHHQQQMKPQLSKQAMQQAQAQALFPSYLQTSQGPNSISSTTSLTAANSSCLQRRRPETQSQQQSQNSPGSLSTGMVSMCSSTVAVNSDPAKSIAVAAAVGNNTKAPAHGISNAAAPRPSG